VAASKENVSYKVRIRQAREVGGRDTKKKGASSAIVPPLHWERELAGLPQRKNGEKEREKGSGQGGTVGKKKIFLEKMDTATRK